MRAAGAEAEAGAAPGRMRRGGAKGGRRRGSGAGGARSGERSSPSLRGCGRIGAGRNGDDGDAACVCWARAPAVLCPPRALRGGWSTGLPPPSPSRQGCGTVGAICHQLTGQPNLKCLFVPFLIQCMTQRYTICHHFLCWNLSLYIRARL